MLVVLYKSALFLFPFIKELFLSKKDEDDSDPQSQYQTGIKKILKIMLIIIGIVSVVANIVLFDKLITTGVRLVNSIKKENMCVIDLAEERKPKPIPKPTPNIDQAEAQRPRPPRYNPVKIEPPANHNRLKKIDEIR